MNSNDLLTSPIASFDCIRGQLPSQRKLKKEWNSRLVVYIHSESGEPGSREHTIDMSIVESLKNSPSLENLRRLCEVTEKPLPAIDDPAVCKDLFVISSQILKQMDHHHPYQMPDEDEKAHSRVPTPPTPSITFDQSEEEREEIQRGVVIDRPPRQWKQGPNMKVFWHDFGSENCCNYHSHLCLFFFGRTHQEIDFSLAGKNMKCLRLTILMIPGLFNLSSRAIAFLSAGPLLPVSALALMGYLVTSCTYSLWGEGREFLGVRYQWSTRRILIVCGGAPGALVAAPLGWMGMAMTNQILGDKISQGQTRFFKQNILIGSIVTAISCVGCLILGGFYIFDQS